MKLVTHEAYTITYRTAERVDRNRFVFENLSLASKWSINAGKLPSFWPIANIKLLFGWFISFFAGLEQILTGPNATEIIQYLHYRYFVVTICCFQFAAREYFFAFGLPCATWITRSQMNILIVFTRFLVVNINRYNGQTKHTV